MYVMKVKNVHRALLVGIRLLETKGVSKNSAHGSVLQYPSPVTTVYSKPKERVVFWPERDSPVFFIFMEALWMLAGRNDVAFLTKFVKRMAEFSDDGIIFHGAYGYRWRNHFNIEGGGHPFLPDQLPVIIERLTKYPDDRRSVLAIWDPVADLNSNTKDPPCNLDIAFSRDQTGRLDMTVFNRSNDILFGAYGANAVHMSMLQEYIAGGIGCPVGKYWQVSNNYHVYTEVFNPLLDKFRTYQDEDIGSSDPYLSGRVEPYPLMSTERQSWDDDLFKFMELGCFSIYKDKFFTRVACPLLAAHEAVKAKCYDDALKFLDNCWATDWQRAAQEWVKRRQTKYLKEMDDGPTYP